VSSSSAQPASDLAAGWLDLRQIATVEVTSEDPDFPVECIFGPGTNQGWRASGPGEQRIRLVFDEPQLLKRMRIAFRETASERTQEFSVKWSAGAGGIDKEILRQRWNFSPSGSTTEVEDYAVDLAGVSSLELVIQPDISSSAAIASLSSWQVR
jgi:hypothetical protein